MFTKITLTMITIILLVALAGCGASTPTNPISNESADNSQGNTSNPITGTTDTDNYQMLPVISGKAADLKLDFSADGTSQQLKKGEVMSITLESNPSTGYSWFATISNQDILVQMGEPEYQEPPSSSATPILGAAGTQTFYFQAADTGTTTLTLEYKQGWDTTTAPEKTFTITLEVK